MKVDFTKPILDLDEAPIIDEVTDKKGKVKTIVATLGVVCLNALMATFRDEESLPGSDKLKRFYLALQVKKGIADLKVEDVTLIKTLVQKLYGPLIVGRVEELLDPPAKTTREK